MTGSRAVRAAVVTGGLVLTTMLVPTSSADTAARLCHGRPATVEPSPTDFRALVGTPGPDVIVAPHAYTVVAGDGDDLICVLGRDSFVDAGPGNDTVDASATWGGNAVRVWLGLGDDHFTGGGGHDVVADGASWPTPPGHDPAGGQDGTDVIETGGGADNVWVSTLGDGRPDVVDSGSGSDRVTIGDLDPGTSLDVGTGAQDVVTLVESGTLAERWLIDAGDRTLSRDGAEWAWRGGVDGWRFHLDFEPALAGFTYVGTDRDESVAVLMRGYRAFPVTTAMGAGDDRIDVGYGDERPPLHLTGGPGTDVLELHSEVALLRLDLGRGRVDDGAGDPAPGTAGSFEWLRASATAVRVVGSTGPDKIAVRGCRGGVRAGPGDDRVVMNQTRGCADGDFWAYGGSGDDSLVGSPADDRLVGGRGDDFAGGRGGQDYCEAELRRSCEVT